MASSESKADAVDPTEKTKGKEDSGGSLGMRLTVKSIKVKFSTVPCISTGTLQTWLDKHQHQPSKLTETNDSRRIPNKVILLDARPEEEFDVSHLKGSRRVDPDAKTDDVTQTAQWIQGETGNLPSTETAVVCYCSLGYRSSLYAQALQKQGHLPEGIKVYNLEGSLFKWANEKRSMVDPDGHSTVYAHPYTAVWGKLLNSEFRKYKRE